MPYTPHTLLTFHGVLGSTATAEQTWSFGYRFPLDATFWAGFIADGGDPVDVATDLMGAFTDNWVGENFASSVYLFGVKMAALDAAGHYQAEPWEAVYNLESAYGTGGTHLPFQDAFVCTFRHVGLGRGNYGRVYLPPLSVSPGADGLLSTGSRATYAGNLQSWVDDSNVVLQALAGAPTSAVISILGNNEVGTVKKVDQTAFGRVIDTQRRRRDKLVEDLIFTAVA